MHDTKVAQERGVEMQAAQEVLLEGIEVMPLAEPTQVKGKRGRPQTIQQAHLWVSLLWSVLLGRKSYTDWWRLFCTQAVGSFAPIAVSADALLAPAWNKGDSSRSSSSPAITRRGFQSGWPHWCKRLWRPGPARLSASTRVRWMRCSVGWSLCVIAPRGIQRSWRARSPVGSTCAPNNGTCCSIASLVWANCKVEVLSLLEGLMPGSLILFDLGYFSFAWFDYLTQMGYCYICRWREKTT